MQTHLDVDALWLVKALRLILGLLLKAGSSFTFVEVAVGKEKYVLKSLVDESDDGTDLCFYTCRLKLPSL